MARIRVFGVIASSEAGGAEETFATLLRRIDPSRFELYVACHGRGPLYEEYRKHSAGVWSLDLLRVWNPASVLRLARLMRQTRCDVVHTCLWSADLLGGAAASLAGVRGIAATVTTEYFRSFGAGPLVRVRRRLLSRVYRATYWLPHRVVTVSRFLADDLVRRPGLRVPARKIEVIYNPLDRDALTRLLASPGASVRRWTDGSPIVTAVANFHPVKGHQTLVRAMPAIVRRYPGVRFVLVGDGPARAGIEALVASLGLTPAVVFTGQVVGGARAMRESDVVVLPSLSEGLGVALLEALAIGTPVVASRTGGIPEVLGEQEAGLLVTPGDPDALADAILAVLDDPDTARRRAERGRQIVAERFTVERFVEQTERLYRTLAGVSESAAAG